MTEIKAVIFDCFGVMVGMGFHAKYQYMGGDLKKDADFIEKLLRAGDSGKLTKAQFRTAATEKLDVTMDEYVRVSNEVEKPNYPLFEYIRNELKPKYKIGMISNANIGDIPHYVPKRELQLFDDVVVSAEVGLLKPEPEIFRLALKRLDVKPEQAIFIDDLQPFIDGAKAVGMKTILYKSLDQLKKDLTRLLQ